MRHLLAALVLLTILLVVSGRYWLAAPAAAACVLAIPRGPSETAVGGGKRRPKKRHARRQSAARHEPAARVYSPAAEISDGVIRSYAHYTREEAAAIAKWSGDIQTRVPQFLTNIVDTQLPYRSAENIKKTSTHYGQRKLLLWEVEFLTRHGGRSKNVVYVGAAPSIKFWLVAQLFPDHEFWLYDSTKFAVKATDRIHLFNRLFTDEDAREMQAKFGGDVLMLSDIRSTPKKGIEDYDKLFEQQVLKNQAAQLRWAEIMEARASSFKIRVPYGCDQYDVPQGDILLQAWAPVSSSEARLELLEEQRKGGKYPTTPVKCGDWDDAFAFHNQVRREWMSFEHAGLTAGPGGGPIPGMDRCYDCAREVQVWQAYMARNPGHTLADLVALADRASKQPLAGAKMHALDPLAPLSEKKRVLAPRGAPLCAGECPYDPRAEVVALTAKDLGELAA